MKKKNRLSCAKFWPMRYTPLPYFLFFFFTFCLFFVDFFKMNGFLQYTGYTIPLKSTCLFLSKIWKRTAKKRQGGVYISFVFFWKLKLFFLIFMKFPLLAENLLESRGHNFCRLVWKFFEKRSSNAKRRS